MHTTTTGNKIKALKSEALELEREAKHLEQARERAEARSRQEQAGTLKAEAGYLQPFARLEDLHVWQMEKAKTTKNGTKTYQYWMTSWREGGKVRNVHLGSCKKLDAEAALQKARAMKAKALGIET